MSIWTELEAGKVTVVRLAAPAVTGRGQRLRARVVEVFEPAPDVDEPPPRSRELLALCAHVAGPLAPGRFAIVPVDAALAPTSLVLRDDQLFLGDGPLRACPWALVELSPTDELDLAALVDLDELRRDLHVDVARAATDAARDAALAGAVARLAHDPRLSARDRGRLADGLSDEVRRLFTGHGAMPKGLTPWPTFVDALPAWTGGKRPDTGSDALDPLDAVGDDHAAVAAPPVYWNTRLLDDGVAVGRRPLEVEHTYTVETGLAAVAAKDAAATSTVAAGVVVDGTVVHFILECDQPILRAPGAAAWAHRVEGDRPYRRDPGDTEPLVAELRPVLVGPVALTVSLCTDHALRASTTIVQFAILPAAPAPPPSVTAPAPVAVSPAALAGPGATLRLELTSDRELRASHGAIFGQPCELAKAGGELGPLTTIAKNARAELVALSRDYKSAAGPPFALPDGVGRACMLKMARIGARLHAAFFGTPNQVADPRTKDLAALIAATTGGRLQIGAGFQPYPWAVFYDGAWRGKPLTDEASVDPSCFWGRRFRIDRAICGHLLAAPLAPQRTGPVRVQACLNPHLDKQQKVEVVDRQRALFDGHADVVPAARIESAASLASYLAEQPGPCDLLYFFCHAHAAATRDALYTFTTTPPDTQAKLVLDASAADALDVARMAELRGEPLAAHPLVFLNACGSVAGDEAFQSPLLVQFLDQWRAAGVLGTDWEVPTLFADAFARELFGHLLRDRLPLGEALARATAAAFAQDNPFALVYALYAPPELQFVRAPSAVTPPGAIP